MMTDIIKMRRMTLLTDVERSPTSFGTAAQIS